MYYLLGKKIISVFLHQWNLNQAQVRFKLCPHTRLLPLIHEQHLEIARLEAVKLLNADPDLLQEAHRALLFKRVARQGGNIWNRVL